MGYIKRIPYYSDGDAVNTLTFWNEHYAELNTSDVDGIVITSREILIEEKPSLIKALQEVYESVIEL